VVVLAVSLAGDPAHALCDVATPCAGAPSNLGTFGGISEAFGVSANGSVVVGYSNVTGIINHAFRWTSAGMVDLGTLGGTASFAFGTSSDGSVVVGYSGITGDGVTHAFRWTAGTGMVDLGTLGGTNSYAYGTNADGSVVVGHADITGNTGRHAFRWTSAGMVDLGTFGGTTSIAYAANADGSVVVGYASLAGNAAIHAFRWTSAGMVDLLTLGGSNSLARAVNADGSVAVGESQIAGNAAYHAFRWTSAGMVDLGILSGGTFTQAFGVSADGSVVVGLGNGSGFSSHAFRWTAATGMRDLNTLLANAGINMTGITLFNANAVSGNGQFIVGGGTFSGATRAYIVRYYDQETTTTPTPTPAPTPAPIVGLTTFSSVQSSINDLSDSRFGVMAQQHGLAAPILGGDKPMGLGNEAGVYAVGGSASGGGFLRYSWGSGFSLLGGLAYAKENYPDADLGHSAIGGLALQYIYSGWGWWRPFVQAGGWYAPDALLSFSRSYMNGAGTATGIGNAHADLSYYFAQAGILLARSQWDQLALGAEYGRERMAVAAYAEPLSSANPFEAHVAPGTDSIDLAKLRLQWSHRFTPRLDGTAWVAGVRGFNRSSELSATVPGIGILMPTDLGPLTWAEYGARIGYRVTDAVTFDVLANGVSGRGGIDTRTHVGAGLRFQF
jgi:probable HAF family extracellular repeat protein